MIRFVLGLGVAVLVVVLFARYVGSVPSASDVLPATPASSAITCESTGGRDLVRVLPDQTVEVVRCEVDQ
ncbi:hypothetical protein [Pseudonocardia halophobica]|uniref:hypothetical protein n=1 Tax=Pseudonocardia halophobica TaxID=29401 RepID=UPI00056736B4|nr:hypothetical protein [Pseudonocardia halophobica]